MLFVVVASLTLAWHFEDEASACADRVLDQLQEDHAVVPSIWPLEVANALVVAERRHRLSPARVARAAELLQELPIVVVDADPRLALRSVLDLARAHGLSADDVASLELAMRAGLPLATRKEAFSAAARRGGVLLAP
jgi:predicted nucleic acid-binding protein